MATPPVLTRFTDYGHKSAAGLKAYCREHLANYEIPKKFIIVDELPMPPVGKVDKKSLKQGALAD